MPCNGGLVYVWSLRVSSNEHDEYVIYPQETAQGWRGLGNPLWKALGRMQLIRSIRRTIQTRVWDGCTRRDRACARAATVVDASNPAAGPRTPRPSSTVRSSDTPHRLASMRPQTTIDRRRHEENRSATRQDLQSRIEQPRWSVKAGVRVRAKLEQWE